MAGPLTDIRAGLRERIEALSEEGVRARKEFDALMESINAEYDLLIRLLNIEEDRHHRRGLARVLLSGPTKPLQDFIVETLNQGPKNKEQLRESAKKAGYFTDNDSSAGRIIHATVVNLMRSGRIQEGQDGTYICHPGAIAEEAESADLLG